VLLLAVVSAKSTTAEITITLTPGREPRVEVVAIPAETLAELADSTLDRDAWQRVFALYVDTNGGRSTPPVLGDYRVQDNRLIFTPQFPLKPGLTYRAVFDVSALRGLKVGVRETPIETKLIVPEPPRGQPTVVEAIYPSGDSLPENLLKFYIHFSAPMSRGGSYRHIRLLDENGVDVDAPFLELAEELWDQSGRRLTLLLDPGRVKQELKPNKEVGRALAQGKAYTLVISDTWTDASGARLAHEQRKNFRVVHADVAQPDPKHWKLQLPAAGTRQRLTVKFNEPLDHALLQHAIQVLDPATRLFDGQVQVSEQETKWYFEPEKPWVVGAYRLLVDTTLEDRAGNSMGRPFEVQLTAARPTEIEECVIPFDIGTGATASGAPPASAESR
jgi:hypothetical protein